MRPDWSPVRSTSVLTDGRHILSFESSQINPIWTLELSHVDSMEQSGARRRLKNHFNRTEVFIGLESSSFNDLYGVKSRYRPVRIVYLGISLWSSKIRSWLLVSKMLKLTYNDVIPSDFWTLPMYLGIPFLKRRLPSTIPDIFPCYGYYRFDFRAVLVTTHKSSGHYSCT